MPTPQEIDQHYREYLSARYANIGTTRFTSISRWVALYAFVAAASITPIDIGSKPDKYFWTTIPATVVVSLLCIYPIIQLRQRSLRSPTPPTIPSSHPSLLSLLTRPFSPTTSSSSPSIKRILAWYAAIAMVLTGVFTRLWEWRNKEVGLEVFRGTRHFPNHLNERFIFLLLGNASFSLLLGVWDVYNGKWSKPEWSTTDETRGARFERALLPLLYTFPIIGSIFTGLFTIGWYTNKVWISRWLIRGSLDLMRQFIFRFARVNFEITPQVVYRLGTLVVVTAFILEVPKILFDINATQPLDFSPVISRMKGVEAEGYLTTALETSDDYLLNFTALQWLDRSHQSSRRTILLSDISLKPTPWQKLWQNLHSQLDKSLKTLSTRGGRLNQPQPTGSAPIKLEGIASLQAVSREQVAIPQAAPGLGASVNGAGQALDQKIEEKALVIKSTSIDLATKLSSLLKRSISAISPYTDPIISTSPLAQSALQKTHAAVDLAHIASAKAAAVTEKAKEVNAVAKGVVGNVERGDWWLGKWAEGKEWLSKKGEWGMLVRRGGEGVERTLARRWARDEVEMMLPRRAIDINLIRTLTAFIANSPTEDPYGQIQRTVPSTLSLFAQYHSALTSFRGEMTSVGKEGKLGEVWDGEVEKILRGEVDGVKFMIENSIKNIASRFGENMKGFELSPGLTSWIDGIVSGK